MAILNIGTLAWTIKQEMVRSYLSEHRLSLFCCVKHPGQH